MNHYFRKTAAFALTGAMLASSIPMPSFAEEDIPEVDDLPAIVEPGETPSNPTVDLPSADENDSKDTNTGKTDDKTQTGDKTQTDDKTQSGVSKRSDNYGFKYKQYIDITNNITSSKEVEDINSVVDYMTRNADCKLNIELCDSEKSYYKKESAVGGDTEKINSVVRFYDALMELVKNDSHIKSGRGSAGNKAKYAKGSSEYTTASSRYSKSGCFSIRDDDISLLGENYITDDPIDTKNKMVAIADKYLPGTAETEKDLIANSRKSEKRNRVCDFENGKVTVTNGSSSKRDEKLEPMETLTFDFVLNDGYNGSVLDAVSSSGGTVNCTISTYWNNGVTVFAKFSGNKGSRALYAETGAMTTWDGPSVTFKESAYMDGDTMVQNADCGPDGERGEFVLMGDTELKDTQFFYYSCMSTSSDKTKMNKAVYTMTEAEKKSGHASNLGTILGFLSSGETVTKKTEDDKTTEIKKPDVIDKNSPENKVYELSTDAGRFESLYRGTTTSGVVSDYRINFIAQFPIDNYTESLADFGSNLTATVVGFHMTRNWVDNGNMTMIRISGSKKEVWFKNNSTEPYSPYGDGIVVNTSYDELVSFDGIKSVYNSDSHTTLFAQYTFANDDNMELKGIVIKYLEDPVEVGSDQIKYIGGGKSTYEKLW